MSCISAEIFNSINCDTPTNFLNITFLKSCARCLSQKSGFCIAQWHTLGYFVSKNLTVNNRFVHAPSLQDKVIFEKLTTIFNWLFL